MYQQRGILSRPSMQMKTMMEDYILRKKKKQEDDRWPIFFRKQTSTGYS